MVYSTDIERVKEEAAIPFKVLATPDDFRKLEEYGVYVISEEVKMRGIDYQTKAADGIELLICDKFSNHRAYSQAINRVGRNAQSCNRFHLNTLTQFTDAEKEQQLRERLMPVKGISVRTNNN